MVVEEEEDNPSVVEAVLKAADPKGTRTPLSS